MRWLILLPAVYAAALAQTTCGQLLAVKNFSPDWRALVVVAWMLSGTGRFDFLVAGAIGLFADCIAPGRPGVGAATFLSAGYGMGLLRRFIPRNNMVCQAVLAGMVAALVALAASAAAWLDGLAPLAAQAWLRQSGGVGLYTMLAGLPIWMALGWLREPIVRRSAMPQV
jgi:rod shape-determining protein MreD